MIEAVFKQIDGLRKIPVDIDSGVLIPYQGRAQDDDQLPQVSVVGGGGQTALGRGVEAGLDAGGLGIVEPAGGGVEHQPVGGVDGAALLEVGGGQIIAGRAGDGPEGLIFQGLHGDFRHVPGGGVVLLVVEAVGIDKVGAGAAQIPGGLVHQLHEGLHGAGNIFGDHVAGFVGGFQHQAVEHILQPHLFPGQQTGCAAGFVEVLQVFLPDGQNIVQIAVFQSQQTGHDLGQAGGIIFSVGVQLIQHRVGIQLNEDGGPGRRGENLARCGKLPDGEALLICRSSRHLFLRRLVRCRFLRGIIRGFTGRNGLCCRRGQNQNRQYADQKKKNGQFAYFHSVSYIIRRCRGVILCAIILYQNIPGCQ